MNPRRQRLAPRATSPLSPVLPPAGVIPPEPPRRDRRPDPRTKGKRQRVGSPPTTASEKAGAPGHRARQTRGSQRIEDTAMYHETAIMPSADTGVRAYLNDDMPIVHIADGEYDPGVKIHLTRSMGAAAQTRWLRSLAAQLEDLAEQVDLRAGTAAAEQTIADAKAAAGLGAS